MFSLFQALCCVFTKFQIILDSSENTSHIQNLAGQTTRVMERYQVINRHPDYRKAA